MQSTITLGIAFFAGLASFLSPCVFALVPAYVGYLSGRSAAASDQQKTGSLSTLRHGFAFVLGFGMVFVVLGALAGALGGLLSAMSGVLVKLGGGVLILFGLHMSKIVQIPLLNYDLRPRSRTDLQRGYLSSAMMGVFFAAGWTPCVGPVLGAILTLSFNQASFLQGALLLSVYSAGLAIPFLLAATQIGWVTTILRRYGKVMHWIEILMGVVLMFIGVLLLFGRLDILIPMDTLFKIVDEVRVGRLLMWWLLISFSLGLIPAMIQGSKERKFTDRWFLASGIVLLVIVLLYIFGVFLK